MEASRAFDDAYRAEVLEPARAAGDRPPEDLRVRYALPDPLTPDAVAARVREVRRCWRRARGQLKFRKLIDRLEAEHRELVPLFQAAERGDLHPLRARLRGGRERAERRGEQAREGLADAAGAALMVTPGELDAIARTAGVAPAELAAFAAAEGIDVREPDPLPARPPYPAYRKVRESLDVLGARHLAAFVLGARTAPMHVVDGFASPAAPAGLGPDAVAAAGARWARRSRDTSTTHADTVLAALRSADPAELVLFDVVDRLRDRLRQRASERALLRYATGGLGVAEQDARRLVFALVRESGPAGGLAGRLRALLDAGEVQAAAALAEASEPPARDGDPPEEAVLAAEARRRLDTALRLRETAAAEPDPDRAWLLLADALRLVRDLPGAERHRRSLPPRPVPAVHADVDGGAVRVSWTPSPSTAGDVRHAVVRREDRPPRDPADGERITGQEAGGAVRDVRAPVNVPLHYAVFAVREDAVAAGAVAGPVVVRPEPADVVLAAGDGVVTGRWRCPEEAARIVVTRDGRGVPATRDGFRERVPNGAALRYRVSAVYLDASGRETGTPGVTATVTPSAPPEPVFELAAEPDPADPGLLRVRFEEPGNGTVELVLADAPPPWPRSALVPLAEVRRATRRLTAVPDGRGLAVRPGRDGWLLAVTAVGDEAAIGACHRHLNLPPPGRLITERRGAYLHVGFDWPDGVAEVEVTRRAGGATATETVSRAAYETGGGIRLPVPEDQAVEVSVAAAGMSGGTPVTGRPVTAVVAARTVVRYDLVRTGPPWRRELTVRLSAPRPLRVRRLSLVRRAGRVMPHRAADGETLAAWDSVPVPGEVSVPAPAAAGPHWLRCFADDDDVELGDPPVRRMRAGR
ncbi:hypothetical protein [Spirillospora albida]|uniref:hypothetical protein n=1 Tax=Spirillospora albida TaxID=58123 RepID=UPI0004BE67C1|nr:hypothetical protein [Spirillospora albida]